MGIGVRLWIGFGLILLCFSVVSLFIVNRMGVLSNITRLMHAHPLAVSNAVLRIDANLTRMHSSMKDVLLARSDAEIHRAVDLVNKYEKDIYRDFEIVAERFLGEKEMYEDARMAFAKWRSVHNEVIPLIQQGKSDEAAAITKDKGARHVDDLNLAMVALGAFAKDKAQAFLDGASETRARTLSVAYTLVILTILSGVIFVTVLTWSITRPLSQLMGSVLEMSLGNLDKRVPVGTDDETGQLARAFNTMADNLKASHADLETKVEQRTQELEVTNKKLESEIGKHRLAEEELRMNSLALDTMMEGVGILRASDAVFVHTNPAFDRMLGYDSGELTGQSVTIINAPTDRSAEEIAAEIISTLNETGLWEGEVRSIKKDGTQFWTYARVSTFQHSVHGNLWLTVQEDITERKQREEQLRGSLEEKNVLLRELYHRTKNNMQVICSILGLQATHTQNEEVKRSFHETENRIQTMALVHQKLYQSQNLSSINLNPSITAVITTVEN